MRRPGGVPALSRPSVDRAAHYRADASWLAEARRRGRVLSLDEQGLTLVEGDEHAPRLVLAAPEGSDEGEAFFLGEQDGVPYFAVLGDAPAPTASWRASLREVGALLDDREAGLFVAAVALANWHATHRHCPRCGAPTRVERAGWVRVCERDGSQHFPRVDPAMIVLVHDGGEHCLLGRQPSWPDGRYSTLAGFVEPGESAELAVVREVAEETRVAVRDVRYVASQPWPFPSSLMLGFTARADYDGDRAIDVDGDEIEDARWFTRAELQGENPPLLPSPVSIAYRLIMGWVDGELC